jgi:hypothetical protein
LKKRKEKGLLTESDRGLLLAIDGCNLLLTSNLVSHSLGLDNGDVINDSLVEVEILGQSITVLMIKSQISLTYFP